MEVMVGVAVLGVDIGDGHVGEFGRVRCSFACGVEGSKFTAGAGTGVVVVEELCGSVRRIGDGEVVGFRLGNGEVAAVVWVVAAVDSQVELLIGSTVRAQTRHSWGEGVFAGL